MTTKQSARLHLEGINRDCFVVLHPPHRLSALLAMTRSGLFQQSKGVESVHRNIDTLTC